MDGTNRTEYQRQWRAANPDKVREQNHRANRSVNGVARFKVYYERHREAIALKAKTRNDEKIAAKQRAEAEYVQMNPRDDLRVAYAAGLFDGEGCVATRNHTGCSAYPIISMSDPRPLLVVASLFGGKVKPNKTRRGYQKRQMWTWVLGGKAATDFFVAIEPYSVLKRDEVVLAITLRGMMRPWGGHHTRRELPEGEIQTRQEIVAQIRSLKRAVVA